MGAKKVGAPLKSNYFLNGCLVYGYVRNEFEMRKESAIFFNDLRMQDTSKLAAILVSSAKPE